MVSFFDISEWEDRPYFSTGGTRDKFVVENPYNGYSYFFKTSLKKLDKDYTYEFWSEIIASELGATCGFDILHYDAALKDGQMGCLSQYMHNPQKEELLEGGSWLNRHFNTYNINDKTSYSFQLIATLLEEEFPQHTFLANFISTIIFDSIIGNGDRHQENWAIITNKDEVQKRPFRRKRTRDSDIYRFAPIYDSGSSLGREIPDKDVERKLHSVIELEAYIRRGTSEVRWEGIPGKLKHCDLIKKISETGHSDIVRTEIARIKKLYKPDALEQIVMHVDDCLPDTLVYNKIPDDRKKFIIKLVNLRIERLFALDI